MLLAVHVQAADRSKEVEVLKKRQAVEETEMKQRRGGVEQELAEVQPLIDQARKAVGQIKKENIDEIRSLKMPPEAIRDVLEVSGKGAGGRGMQCLRGKRWFR